MTSSAVELFRAIFALGFVLGLIWLLGYAIRRYGARWGLAAPLTAQHNRRLKIIEVMSIDGKNRLALIQRDNVQHLLVIGQDGTHTIESGIAPIGAGNNEKHS